MAVEAVKMSRPGAVGLIMAMLLHSVDRSFCMERCFEVGVCFKSSIGYLCLCDSGEVGSSCGAAVGVTLSIPTEILSYWPFFVAWVILGVIVGFVTLIVMWLKQRRSRMVPASLDEEAAAVAMAEPEPAVAVIELERLEEFEELEGPGKTQNVLVTWLGVLRSIFEDEDYV